MKKLVVKLSEAYFRPRHAGAGSAESGVVAKCDVSHHLTDFLHCRNPGARMPKVRVDACPPGGYNFPALLSLV